MTNTQSLVNSGVPQSVIWRHECDLALVFLYFDFDLYLINALRFD